MRKLIPSLRFCAVALFALQACSGDRPQHAVATDSVQAAPPPAAQPATHPAVAKDTTPSPPMVALLRDVRAGSHDQFDRVVFQFDGPLPPYRVAYTEQITECGSGNGVDLPGNAWLAVRFSPANAHTEAGEASGAPRQIGANGKNLRGAKQVCDFEGVVEWAIALDRAGKFNVVELSNPTRVAIDITQ